MIWFQFHLHPSLRHKENPNEYPHQFSTKFYLHTQRLYSPIFFDSIYNTLIRLLTLISDYIMLNKEVLRIYISKIVNLAT